MQASGCAGGGPRAGGKLEGSAARGGVLGARGASILAAGVLAAREMWRGVGFGGPGGGCLNGTEWWRAGEPGKCML